MVNNRPWAFVLSEYLDLPFVLRTSGQIIVSARSAREAMDCLGHWCPSRIIIDMGCVGASQVISYARKWCPNVPIIPHDQVINELLAS